MNQNKINSMDAVGEIAEYENLLLREGGYPHLPASDAWNEAGTKPDHPCLCRTRTCDTDDEEIFQYWNGEFWGDEQYFADRAKENGHLLGMMQNVQWREVQQ
jgi:hypothetical protein